MNVQQRISALSVDAEKRLRLLHVQCEELALTAEQHEDQACKLRRVIEEKQREINDIVGPAIEVESSNG